MVRPPWVQQDVPLMEEEHVLGTDRVVDGWVQGAREGAWYMNLGRSF